MYSTPTPSSVAIDTPSSSASRSGVSILGSSPFSKRYSAAREMSRRRAISSALRPDPRRNAFSRLPMSSKRKVISGPLMGMYQIGDKFSIFIQHLGGRRIGMANPDLRDWLAQMDAAGELQKVSGANREEE